MKINNPPPQRCALAGSLAIALLGLAALPSIGCSAPPPEAATANPAPIHSKTSSAPETDAAENIAIRILKLDAQVKPVTAQMFQTLNEVLDDACAGIGKLRRNPDRGWDRNYARQALRRIDAALIDHGFLYPEAGAVDLLADALTPFQMKAEQRRAFAAQPHNLRRADMISQRFPGPFHVADCDTAGFIYLAVAERLNLPLHLVVIPSHNRHPGHAFVRWREGSGHLDWETMDGKEVPDGHYRKEWTIPFAEIDAQAALADLTASQVMGCAHHLLAIQYERRKDYERALQELALALELYPQCVDARREFAWVAATAPGVRDRRAAEAIANASFAARLADDPDAHDTLAAAYASAGMFDLAVKAQRAALSHRERAREYKADYTRRLQLYLQNQAYRQEAVPANGN